MDLPRPSFESPCSPQKVSIARDGFHLLRKSSVVVTLIAKVLLNSFWFILLNNGLNIAGNEVSSFRWKIHKWGAICDHFDAVCMAIIRLCCYIVYLIIIIIITINQLKLLCPYCPFHTKKLNASRDVTVLIDLLWFNVVHYSSLFQYFFSIYYGPYSSRKFLIF